MIWSQTGLRSEQTVEFYGFSLQRLGPTVVDDLSASFNHVIDEDSDVWVALVIL